MYREHIRIISFVATLLALTSAAEAQQTGTPWEEGEPFATDDTTDEWLPPSEEQHVEDREAPATAGATAPAARPGVAPGAPTPGRADPASRNASTRTAPRPRSSTAPARLATGATGQAEDEEDRDVSQDRLLHGFRLGYLFIANVDAAWDESAEESYRDHYDLRSEHQFIFGYELTWRMIGHDWLNVLLVGNILVAGVEQSRFFPSLNALLGFEIEQTFQLGVGVDLTPTKERAAHMLVAAGWTPRVGGFYLPLHFFFIPDVHAHHRFGVTTGVSW